MLLRMLFQCGLSLEIPTAVDALVPNLLVYVSDVLPVVGCSSEIASTQFAESVLRNSSRGAC